MCFGRVDQVKNKVRRAAGYPAQPNHKKPKPNPAQKKMVNQFSYRRNRKRKEDEEEDGRHGGDSALLALPWHSAKTRELCRRRPRWTAQAQALFRALYITPKTLTPSVRAPPPPPPPPPSPCSQIKRDR